MNQPAFSKIVYWLFTRFICFVSSQNCFCISGVTQNDCSIKIADQWVGNPLKVKVNRTIEHINWGILASKSILRSYFCLFRWRWGNRVLTVLRMWWSDRNEIGIYLWETMSSIFNVKKNHSVYLKEVCCSVYLKEEVHWANCVKFSSCFVDFIF